MPGMSRAPAACRRRELTTRAKSATDVDAYIARRPKGVQRLLRQLRAAVRRAAPDARETISYGMPALRARRILVWFGAHEKHIGLYPGASGVAKFKADLSRFEIAKGSIRFPLDEPLPLALIGRIVRFRAREKPTREKQKA